MKPAKIHPQAPEKLKKAFIDHGRNVRELARTLAINPYYVQRAIKHNEKPSNKKLQRKLFFIESKKRVPVPEWKKKLKKVPKEKRDKIFEALLTGKYKLVKSEMECK